MFYRLPVQKLLRRAVRVVGLGGIALFIGNVTPSSPIYSACSPEKRSEPVNNIIVHREYNIRAEEEPHKEYSLTFEDGSAYDGEVVGKMMHGIGTLTIPTGLTYSGRFVNGTLIGQGTIEGPTGSFIGEIVNWEPHGVGKIIGINGSLVSEGRFVHGKLHGRGECHFEDQSYFEGEFEHGIPHGQGKMTTLCTVSEGFFEDSVLTEGTITHTDGSIEQGTFKNGTLVGWGKCTWANNTTIEGMFELGIPTGVVTVTRKDSCTVCDVNSLTYKYYNLLKYLNI